MGERPLRTLALEYPHPARRGLDEVREPRRFRERFDRQTQEHEVKTHRRQRVRTKARPGSSSARGITVKPKRGKKWLAREWTRPMTFAAYSALLTARWWRPRDGERGPWVFYSPWATKKCGREEPGVYGARLGRCFARRPIHR